MHAEAVIRAETAPPRPGRRGLGQETRIVELRGQAPLLPRIVAVPGTGAEVVLVGGAAGPLGGDELAVRIEVGAGARLTVRTAAAAVVLPGTGEPARQRVEITVADGGELDWLPEPAVVAAGARFETALHVTLGRATRLLLRETLLLGRAAEPCGDAVSRWDIAAEGRPLLRQVSAYGPGAKPGWRGPAGTAGGTVVATELRFPDIPGTTPRLPSAPGRAVCELAGGGLLTTVMATDALTADRLLRGQPAVSRAVPAPSPSAPPVPLVGSPS
ncbi:urease accessory protein UreD [Yinghuangia seranimata]|uniref:urease accessory protein UreD n=1 Tax=Yinghuangia seranimata TaxID=408067 RepID=UPI00248C5BA1|nr:urease accessory protein UreD [Yinghuangia seranimata]MDI2125170.1 urease accessory protein UreD [Yinghuangia seranimata]